MTTSSMQVHQPEVMIGVKESTSQEQILAVKEGLAALKEPCGILEFEYLRWKMMDEWWVYMYLYVAWNHCGSRQVNSLKAN